VGFGVSPKQSSSNKVRDDKGAIASRRDERFAQSRSRTRIRRLKFGFRESPAE
jgi:hypothetical protein